MVKNISIFAFEDEQKILIASNLYALKAIEDGMSPGKAYDEGLKKEKDYRESLKSSKKNPSKINKPALKSVYVKKYGKVEMVKENKGLIGFS